MVGGLPRDPPQTRGRFAGPFAYSTPTLLTLFLFRSQMPQWLWGEPLICRTPSSFGTTRIPTSRS